MEKTETKTEVVANKTQEFVVNEKEVTADQAVIVEETGSIDEAEFKIIEKRLKRKMDLR
jgi:hypothetical protein